MGIWLNRDPIEELGGLNLYVFVENDTLGNIDLNGEIPLDTIWDLGNVIYDIAVGDEVALAADTAALFVPYVPAGASKLVKVAKAADVVDITKCLKTLKVTYKYIGVADRFTKHTLPRSALKKAWVKLTQNGPSKFVPGWGDPEIKALVERAVEQAKAQGKIKPSELDNFVFDAGAKVGASNGKLTTKIKLKINANGENLHAFPID